MRVIIAGSRNLEDYATMVSAVEASGFTITEVVSGGASGADGLGEQWAAEHGVPVKVFPANWAKYGRSAGPRRNDDMAAYAEALIALPVGESKGTRHMIRAAQKRGIAVYVHEAE